MPSGWLVSADHPSFFSQCSFVGVGRKSLFDELAGLFASWVRLWWSAERPPQSIVAAIYYRAFLGTLLNRLWRGGVMAGLPYSIDDMTIPELEPTPYFRPSPSFLGDPKMEPIYTEVGRALSLWEHMEMSMVRLYQVFCESQSFAACRAYGVIESPFTKSQLIRQACETFFRTRDDLPEAKAAAKKLITAYERGSQYRNNVAHGIACAPLGPKLESYGYFLCPPTYSSKKHDLFSPSSLESSTYYYRAKDIVHYSKRFESILNCSVRLSYSVNQYYEILPPGELHR